MDFTFHVGVQRVNLKLLPILSGTSCTHWVKQNCHNVFVFCLFIADKDGAQQLVRETSDRLTVVACDISSDESVSLAKKIVADACEDENIGKKEWPQPNGMGRG